MATSFKDAREQLVVAYDDGVINTEEFALLYDINKSKNLDLPYQCYDTFDLDMLCDDECSNEFRFLKNDIFMLAEALQIPEKLSTYNRITVDGIEALCVFLKRFSYPCRYADMIPRFGRPVPQICMISNLIMDHVYSNFRHLLNSFNQA